MPPDLILSVRLIVARIMFGGNTQTDTTRTWRKWAKAHRHVWRKTTSYLCFRTTYCMCNLRKTLSFYQLYHWVHLMFSWYLWVPSHLTLIREINVLPYFMYWNTICLSSLVWVLWSLLNRGFINWITGKKNSQLCMTCKCIVFFMYCLYSLLHRKMQCCFGGCIF